MKNKIINTILFSTLFTYPAYSNEESKPLTINAFVDTYYAYDLLRPIDNERKYTTQPLRHNEFNINLAYIATKYNSDNIRGNIALATGTYVESNYILETPLLRNIFEANAGYKIIDNLWIDAGVFPSHIGIESAISKDNWNYSRSLISDNTPYYLSGLKLTYNPYNDLLFSFLLVNGWQNIKDNNDEKSIGTQIQYKINENINFNWSTFIGNEINKTSPSLIRFYNNLWLIYELFPYLKFSASFDLGIQQKDNSFSRFDFVTGASILSRLSLFDDKLFISGRLEFYSDPNQIIVSTKSPNGFQTIGGSINFDYNISKNLMYRIEFRTIKSIDNIYPSINGLSNTDSFIVTSISFSL